MSGLIKNSDGQAVIKSRSGKVFVASPSEAQRLVDQGEYLAASGEDIKAHNAAETSSAAGAAARHAIVGTVGGAVALPKLATALGSAAIGAEDPLAEISGRKFYADMAAAAQHFTGGDLAAEDEARAGARTQLLSDEEAHPYASLGGEVAGNIAGAGVGGLGAAGRAVGGLAARGAGALGAGAGVARLAGGVSSGVLEGGAFGADAASEAAWVKDAPLTSQQSLAAIGLGALFGGGISVGGAALSKLPAVARLLRSGEGVEGAAAADEALGGRAVIAAEEKAAPAAIDRVPEGWMEKGRAWVNDMGDEAAVDAISRGNKPALKRLGGGEAPSIAKKQETGALLHEMGILAPGRGEAEMWQLAEQKAAENGRRMGKVLETVDHEAGYVTDSKVVQRIEDIAGKIESESTSQWGPEGEKLGQFIRDRTEKLRELDANGILKHSDLHNYRMYLDDLAKWDSNTSQKTAAAAREMRQVVSDEIREALDRASPDLRAEWDQANARFGAARWAENTLGERVSVRSGANRMLSPSDYGTALATAVGAGNPLVGLAAGLGNKLLRERGYSTFAAVAKKIAGEAVDVSAAPAVATQTARKLSALVAHSTEQVESGIGNFLGGTRGGAMESRATSPLVARMRSSNANDARAAYAEHVQEVQKVATSPEIAADRMASITGSTIPLYAPGLHAEMVATASRGAQYLASVAPAPAQDPNTITPQVKTAPPVSTADARTYAERVEGVENPLSLLKDMNSLKGVRAEKVEAVKAVHPQLFEQMRQSLFTHLAERATPVPKRMRTTLEITFDAGGTIDPSLSPQNLGVMKLASDQLKAAGAAKAKAPAPKASGMLATRSNQISGGPR